MRPDGTVKVLDFGLAKVTDATASDGALSHSPTAMASMPGVLLGTAAYMSPEQVKGHTADARADVGVRLPPVRDADRAPAFAAPTMTEIFASVLTAEPEWARLPANTPEPVRRLLRRCLQKNAAARLRALGDARLEIDDAANPDTRIAASSSESTARRERVAWSAAVIALGVPRARRRVARLVETGRHIAHRGPIRHCHARCRGSLLSQFCCHLSG